VKSSEKNAWRTAITRKTKSRPMTTVQPKIPKEAKVLDYGCGRGIDADLLKEEGYNVSKFDPHFFPDRNILTEKFDFITCFYVLNVIEEVEGQINVCNSVRQLLNENGVAVFAIRGDKDAISGMPCGKGFISRSGSYQRGYEVEDFPELISVMNRGGLEVTNIYMKNHMVVVETRRSL